MQHHLMKERHRFGGLGLGWKRMEQDTSGSPQHCPLLRPGIPMNKSHWDHHYFLQSPFHSCFRATTAGLTQWQCSSSTVSVQSSITERPLSLHNRTSLQCSEGFFFQIPTSEKPHLLPIPWPSHISCLKACFQANSTSGALLSCLGPVWVSFLEQSFHCFVHILHTSCLSVPQQIEPGIIQDFITSLEPDGPCKHLCPSQLFFLGHFLPQNIYILIVKLYREKNHI